jgi:hemolysin activation/secretion protein
MKASLFTATFVLMASAATFVHAQAVPSTVEPGLVQERLQPQRQPQASGQPIIEGLDQQQPAVPVIQASEAFTLSTVNVEGNTAISDEALREHYAHLLGKPVALSTMQQVAARMTAQYRNSGYILSRAFVPAQQVQNGTVTIQVVEGYVDDVKLAGNYPSADQLLAYAESIKASRPLNVQDLERGLLLMDDLAGMTARGTLAASPTNPGASTLTVTLDREPLEAEANVNNRGSRFLGPAQGELAARANGMLGMYEQFSARTVHSLNLDELNYYELAYEQPVGSAGTRVRGLASYTKTEPGNALSVFDIEGESTAFEIQATHPVLRTRRENLYAFGGLNYRDSESDTFGFELYNDKIRTANIGAAYDVYDNWLNLNGINQFVVNVTQGLDVLGANDSGDLTSRSNADTNFTKFNAEAQRLQDLGKDFALKTQIAGQYSLDGLFVSEEFAIGSLPFGSAFDPAEITGEHGIAGRVELQHLNPVAVDWLNNSQVYAFYDVGRVWNKDSLAGEDKGAALSSTGVGLRTELLDDFEAGAEVAFPLTKKVSAEQSSGPRVFFNVGYKFP